MSLGEIINQHIVWIAPIITIIFSLAFNICAKPDQIAFKAKELLDFGFDLAIAAIVMILSGISTKAENWLMGVFLLVSSFAVVIICAIIIRRFCWDKPYGNRLFAQKKWSGVVISDILGVLLWLISGLFLGGKIK